MRYRLRPKLLATKGLYGSLIHTSGVTRFFGVHGALLPLWCGNDRKARHRAMGNASSTPRTALALQRACQTLRTAPVPSAEEVLGFCLSHRVDALNAVFVPFDEGWVVCRDALVPMVLTGLLHHPAFPVSEGNSKLEVDSHFWVAFFRGPDEETKVFCPSAMSPQALLQALGFQSTCNPPE